MISVLIVAGLDPSGGAGLLADARVAERHGARAMGVVTAQTVQDTRGVRAVHASSPSVIGEQLAALLSDVELSAVKIGMLATEEIAGAVAGALALTAAPVVWDPVGAPTAGSAPLFAGELLAAASLLSPHLAVVTPNLPEASALCGFDVVTGQDQLRAAVAISAALGCAAVVKGGHLPVAETVTDIVATGGATTSLEAPRVEGGGPVHGTGCAFSTALACELARGLDVSSAAESAGRFVRARLQQPVVAGRGHASVM